MKVELIRLLNRTGLKNIEATSFVSPKWVPQMGDHAEVMGTMEWAAGVSYPVLTPNMKGFEGALQAGAKEVAVFGAASDAFSRKNTNGGIEEVLSRFVPICDLAAQEGVLVRGYVSCAVGCPYEGAVDPAATASVAEKLLAMGCYEVSLGDTIGVGTPATVGDMCDAVIERVPVEKLAMHCHDTYGTGLVCVLTALGRGISVIDSSVAGLGGCPYAKGATGNVATEDVLYMLHGMGISTGVDLDAVIDAGDYICGVLGRETRSNAARAIMAKRAASSA